MQISSKPLTKATYLIIIALIILIVFFRFKGIWVSAGRFWSTISIIIDHPFATYDEKMDMKYPRFYSFMRQVKSTTPSNSIIYLPKEPNLTYGEPMWPISNIQMINALLYPRTIIAHDSNNSRKKDQVSRTYIIQFDPVLNQLEDLIEL